MRFKTACTYALKLTIPYTSFWGDYKIRYKTLENGSQMWYEPGKEWKPDNNNIDKICSYFEGHSLEISENFEIPNSRSSTTITISNLSELPDFSQFTTGDMEIIKSEEI